MFQRKNFIKLMHGPRRIRKRQGKLLALALAGVLAVGSLGPVSVSAATMIPAAVAITQSPLKCTLTSVAMMIRSRMALAGISGWEQVTEADVGTVGWVTGGLSADFTYKTGSQYFTITRRYFSGSPVTVSDVESLLAAHPEGFVLYAYAGSSMHAVFVTDVENGIIYCYDPAPGFSEERMPIASSWLGRLFGNQESILAVTGKYWYISETNVPEAAGSSVNTAVPTSAAAENGAELADAASAVETPQSVSAEQKTTTVEQPPVTEEASFPVYSMAVSDRQLIPDGVYYIASRLDTDYVIDIRGGSKKSEANVQLFRQSDARKGQKFRVTYLGKGYYSIINTNSGLPLHAKYAGMTPGTNVWQYQVNGYDAQIWEIRASAKSGFYNIVNKESGLYIDVNKGKVGNGRNIKLWTGKSSDRSEQFVFLSAD